MRRSLVSAFVIAVVLCRGIAAEVSRASPPQEQAEFLAGIPLGKGSFLHPLQKLPEYQRHQQELQERWLFCRQVRYGAMQQWARAHLAYHPAARGVLRYLFGGPDFLNAYAFFPDARVMVLGGLEPVGEVPPPEALDPRSLGAALQALDEALHTSLFAGYFITSEMKPQLAQGAFRGVLPVLYTELALTGNILNSVSMERPFGSPGARITYHRPGGAEQTLWYFQADLSNGKECQRFLSWLSELGPGASYLKAASYLLPLDSFSETRNFLIRTSGLILQDDSGLPYRCFLPGEWRISLYGVYTDPLEIFKLRREHALSAAFDSPLREAPLSFGTGYHVNGNDANLLLSVRHNEARTPQNFEAEAPQAVPAFATPTPRPAKVRIRKALPVPIRKAIPVRTPAPTPEPLVEASPPSVAPSPDSMPALKETPATPTAVSQPVETPVSTQDVPPVVQSIPAEPFTLPVAPPLEQTQPSLAPTPEIAAPTTRDGKPID